ncbi:RNA methyltransferase [Leucobacter sp. UT-8R-CII-1-4]|uniref:TrmH family RNA methyltransferase n=1 Tax=Leucobacter sp. UT-8R-CII-1-4 TaxID=3040075 RepID=UPI0024A8B388|nr:RNA methyltransferase [Leucobacter sp. UT-8R-CII-1-4]MDI6022917.1 RNA methyltransferase [Leucobacter sp. UT-8R-CII-1-4]
MIENPKAPRVRRIAALARKKDRLALGQFLVEGPLAVRELLTYAADRAVTVYATMGGESWQFEIDRLADAADVEIVRVTDEVLAAMAQTVQPQGVVAVARIVEVSLVEALADAKLVAVLHEVRDPGNAGTVLRAADAAGADAVIFAGESIDPWNPKVVRSTTGSLFHLPVAIAGSLEEAIGVARAAGLQVIAADVNGEELGIDDERLAAPTAWVFGNEARGLTEQDRLLADRAMRLPIYGSAESLNLATAASVCLYTTAFSQRR